MTDLKNSEVRPKGRPRSEKARRAILEAAVKVLEDTGLAGATVEAIASRAGVSKTTIYRWWPNRTAVVMDAFFELTAPGMEFVDTGDVHEDLKLQMRRVVRMLNGETGKMIAALVAEGQSDGEIAEAFRTRWVATRREVTKDILKRGVDRSELRSDVDLDVAMDVLYGPIYYRLLIGHAPLEESFADQLIEHVVSGLALKGA